MIDASFLTTLDKMVRAGLDPRELKIADPRMARWIVDGQVQEFELPPQPRMAAVDRLASLTSAVDVYGTAGQSSIWHDQESAILVLDDNGHRLESVELTLRQTPAFRTLQRLAVGPGGSTTWMGHRDFLQLLKYDLEGCLPHTLPALVRQVRVSADGSKSSEINPGRERGTSEFRRELQGAQDWPDIVTASLEVWDLPDLETSCQVRCGLELDLDRLQFALQPLAQDLLLAQDQASQKLHQALQDQVGESTAIFYGRP